MAIALWVLPWPIDDPDIISKGPPILVVNRKTDLGSETVPSDVPLAPGDSIRFTVKAAGCLHPR